MSAWEDVLLGAATQPRPTEWWWAYVESIDPLRIRRELEDVPIGSTPSTLVADLHLRVGDKVRVINYLGQALIVGKAGGLVLPIATGRVDITPSGANTPTSRTITFPAGRFTAAPEVLTSIYSTAPGTLVTGTGATGISTSSATIWVTRSNTTTTTVGWVAIQA